MPRLAMTVTPVCMTQLIKKSIKVFRQEGIFGFAKKVHHWFWFRWQVIRGKAQPIQSAFYYNYITDMTRDPRRDPRIKSEDDNEWMLKRVQHPNGHLRHDEASGKSFEQPLVSLGVSSELTINWVIPDMSKGSGGHMTIFRMVKYLQSFGHQNRVYIFGGCRQRTDKELKEFVDENFIQTGAEFFTTLDEIKDCDVLIATSWQTAYPVKATQNCRRKFYFVQDFEPWFYPIGAEYKFAENTYKFGFNHITAGPWLTKILRENYQAEADYFDLAYDHKIYHSNYQERERKDSRAIIAFYARPVTPRRAFELGVQAFRELNRRGVDFEVWLFGWENGGFEAKFKCRNLGVLDQKNLAYIYNNVDLGVVFSTTNYSLLPQELMACSCPVLDLKGPTTEAIFQDNENIFLAEPDPIKIADKIEFILTNKDIRDKVVKRAEQYVQQFSWEKSARKVESVLLNNLQGVIE